MEFQQKYRNSQKRNRICKEEPKGNFRNKSITTTSRDVLNIRMKKTEKTISEVEYRTTDITQFKQQREK